MSEKTNLKTTSIRFKNVSISNYDNEEEIERNKTDVFLWEIKKIEQNKETITIIHNDNTATTIFLSKK